MPNRSYRLQMAAGPRVLVPTFLADRNALTASTALCGSSPCALASWPDKSLSVIWFWKRADPTPSCLARQLIAKRRDSLTRNELRRLFRLQCRSVAVNVDGNLKRVARQ